MAGKIPILLSFHALSNGKRALVFGQLTFTGISDLSFKDYSRRKTFRTLFRLYRTKPYANQSIILYFEQGKVETSTNTHGAFYVRDVEGISGSLHKVELKNGDHVKLIHGLYGKRIHDIHTPTIVVSDIDDTLVHSFIYKTVRKFRTLMFTTMEKRKAVTNMQELIQEFVREGAQPVYLSNSEQNLYPIIYRFLSHNHFPNGPLFLKQLRTLWDVLWNIKFPVKNIHKTTTLEDLIHLFPGRKFVLMGDNTQHDLSIYLNIATKYPTFISTIIIRKVVAREADERVIKNAEPFLKEHNITLRYADKFPVLASHPELKAT